MPAARRPALRGPTIHSSSPAERLDYVIERQYAHDALRRLRRRASAPRISRLMTRFVVSLTTSTDMDRY
jgi:hypothetical protein